MLRSMNDFENCSINATDGDIGHVKDFYFDDLTWVIRYLIVDTGSWLSSRKVLISPMAIETPNWEDKTLSVSLTKAQVKSSPDIDTDMPVSRQHEIRTLGYYGHPLYWGGAGLWGAETYPNLMMTGYAGAIGTPLLEQPGAEVLAAAGVEAEKHQRDDPHLRSCQAILDYHIEATDGDIGHVQGILVDEQTWAIRYLIVNTSNWWLGHKVLIAPQWIHAVRWPDMTVSLNLTRQMVQDAPPYDESVSLEREQEIGIHAHYGHAGYWEAEMEREEVLSPD